MIKWGWSGLAHDAALCVFHDDTLVFASQSERYSRLKNDKFLNQKIINEALTFGSPQEVYFYERPYLKKLRQLYAQQWGKVLNPSPSKHLQKFGINKKIIYNSHHLSHAATGYYTGPFEDSLVLCIDGIGEWETLTAWVAKKGKLEKIYSQNYPHSLGLWYSAMTQRVGLKPLEHEYIFMGMAALGDPNILKEMIEEDFFFRPKNNDPLPIFLKHNLHRGCQKWRPHLKSQQDLYNIAAACQKIYEEKLQTIAYSLKLKTGMENIVFSGGCALNSKANTILRKLYANVWIFPSPGDSGSAIGAVLAQSKKRTLLQTPYLGHDIKGEYPSEEIVNTVLKNKFVGVASGRAEFGPRALGNRSLLADPRDKDIKDKLNQIKKREPFRPFAPVILEEHFQEYFSCPDKNTSPYMQFTFKCKRPEFIPGAIHVDKTSRVQTVSPKNNPGLYNTLKLWYDKTGCPVLLNTSLNIKGEPIVNTKEDAKEWQQTMGITIC